MSSTTQSQMPRDELEELRSRIDDLENQVEKLSSEKVNRTAINVLVDALTDGVEDFTADPGQHKHLLEEIHEEFGDLQSTIARLDEIAETEQSLSNDKSVSQWMQVVEKARTLSDHRNHGLPNNRVKLFKSEVANALDCTERWALKKIETFGEEKQNGVETQKYKRHTTARKTESSDIQQKALIIDLNVWGDGGE